MNQVGTKRAATHVAFTRVARWLLVAAFLVPLALHAYAGAQSRWMADDFCHVNTAREVGVLGSVAYYRETWSGRFSFYVVASLVSLGGTGAAALLPGVALLGWYAGLVWLVWQLGGLAGLHERGYVAGLTSAVILFAALDGSPNVPQTLYWMAGNITYIFPLVILTWCASLTLYALRRPANTALLVAVALLLFVNTGFSETAAVFQLALLGLGLLAVPFVPPAQRRRWLLWFGVGLVVSLTGLALVATAPGNAIRAAQFPPRVPLPVVAGRSLYVATAFTATAFGMYWPVTALATLALTAWLAYTQQPRERVLWLTQARTRWLLLASAALVYAIVLVCVSPTIYTLSVAPQNRMYIYPQLALVAGTIAWGYIIGTGMRRNDPRERFARPPLSSALAVALVVLVVVSVWGVVGAQARLLPHLTDYAAGWDARDAQLWAAAAGGETRGMVAPFANDAAEMAELNSVGSDPDHWVNRCAAAYYGLEKVIVTGEDRR